MSRHRAESTSESWYRTAPTTRGDLVPGWRYPLAVSGAALLTAAVAVVLCRRLAGTPFAPDAERPWLVAAALLALAAAAVVLRGSTRVRRWVAAVGVVALSTWSAAFITAQLAGTPFAYGGMYADTARLSALATRFTVSVTSADPFVDDTPAEYPTLFPWLVGRTAVLIDVPAWRLLAPACALAVAAALVLGWVLWRRLVGDLGALAVTAVAVFAAGLAPNKCFQVVALAVLLPWLISTFMRLAPEDGGLHWLPAGLVGGFMVQLYQAYLLFTIFAMVALFAINLLASPRWPYVRHLVLAAVTSLVVSAWYLVPWMWALATRPSSQVSDEFRSSVVVNNPYYLPWDQTGLTFFLIVAGVGLSLLFVRTTVWAPVMLAVVASSYLFRVLASIRFEETGHTLFLHYTHYTISAATAAALVLGARELWVRSDRALRLSVRSVTAVAAVVVAVVGSVQVVLDEVDALVPPAPLVASAHAEPWPDLRATEYADEVEPVWPFPSDQVRRAVDRAYGDHALPVVLSDSERLFGFYPMHAYMSRDRTATSSLQTWDDRHAELQRLAAIEDPEEFAAATDDSEYGTIDVFVLRGGARPTWLDVEFRREQFGPEWFDRKKLESGYTMFLRRGADVENQRYPR